MTTLRDLDLNYVFPEDIDEPTFPGKEPQEDEDGSVSTMTCSDEEQEDDKEGHKMLNQQPEITPIFKEDTDEQERHCRYDDCVVLLCIMMVVITYSLGVFFLILQTRD